MKYLDIIAAVLLVIGGLNWGLVGLFHFNLVEAIFANDILQKVIYGLVGVAAIYEIFNWKHSLSGCCKKHD
jgi:uncharacterized protein